MKFSFSFSCSPLVLLPLALLLIHDFLLLPLIPSSLGEKRSEHRSSYFLTYVSTQHFVNSLLFPYFPSPSSPTWPPSSHSLCYFILGNIYFILAPNSVHIVLFTFALSAIPPQNMPDVLHRIYTVSS